MARPKKIVNPEALEKLSELCCTLDEAALFFNMPRQTLSYRMERNRELREAWERGQGRGKLALRRAQWQAAMNGNPAMMIWLGKQLLGQADKQETKIEERQSFVIKAPAPLSAEEWSAAFSPKPVTKQDEATKH